MRRKLIKSEFGKNVLTLMTGTTIAQLFPLLLIPVLTRLFSPEEFGFFAFYLSLITFLAVISTGRYEQAIVLPKQDKEAINVLALSVIILVFFVALLLLVLLLFDDGIKSLINVPSLDGWIWFIPLGVFLAGAYRIFTYWSNRKKRFKGTSLSVMSQSTSRVATQLVGGLEKYGVMSGGTNPNAFFKSIFQKAYVVPAGATSFGLASLILSYFIGFFLGLVVLLVPFFKRDRSKLKDVSILEMKRMGKVYEKFPKINSFHALGDEFKNVGVSSTLLFVFGDLILGFYSLTFRILRAPLAVIGNSFGQVFYQKAAEMHANQQNYVPLIKSTVKKLSLIALPIFLTILFFGPQLFDFILGEKWRVAGVYAVYLTPWLFLSFVVAPVQQIGIIVNRQGGIFLFSLLGNTIILGSILLGGFVFKNILHGFLLLSILQIGYYIWVYLWIINIAKKDCQQFTTQDD
jgi:O-antigen/teichoic acid export membrane protein